MRSISGGYWGWRWLATSTLLLLFFLVPACGQSDVDIKSQTIESEAGKDKNEMEEVQVASLPEENVEAQGEEEKRQTLRRQSPQKVLKRLQKDQEYVDEVLSREDKENAEISDNFDESDHLQFDPESAKKFPPMLLPDFQTL